MRLRIIIRQWSQNAWQKVWIETLRETCGLQYLNLVEQQENLLESEVRILEVMVFIPGAESNRRPITTLFHLLDGLLGHMRIVWKFAVFIQHLLASNSKL
ncbi:hypothetical protein GCK72_004029 [Caenorhabditis remanei]|uniref:Uncharacterized protein n=1 Tax=Caenorhabditis remanei TaxID=31234 RepID=A0A6A5HCI0_CAERE|nr:hypothetical protein GCK72_004029 [Caenorhabditis remanei]KAF1764083.1 hypothetical protein GCK72_004029 [Caenorhabditis remanei]